MSCNQMVSDAAISLSFQGHVYKANEHSRAEHNHHRHRSRIYRPVIKHVKIQFDIDNDSLISIRTKIKFNSYFVTHHSNRLPTLCLLQLNAFSISYPSSVWTIKQQFHSNVRTYNFVCLHKQTHFTIRTHAIRLSLCMILLEYAGI